jgi:hypothetical protein
MLILTTTICVWSLYLQENSVVLNAIDKWFTNKIEKKKEKQEDIRCQKAKEIGPRFPRKSGKN